MHNIAVACAVIIGAVLVFAGVSKLVALEQWRMDARTLGVPHGVAIVVPVYESALGLGLIFGIATVVLALIAASTLAAMTLLLVKTISPADVARNMCLIVLAIVAAVGF